MRIHVDSEIGRLRRVLLHRPGREIDRMTPSMMDRLLFDDILYGDEAREEHDLFRHVLRQAGAEVLDARDLLVEALAVEAARYKLFHELEHEFGVAAEMVDRLEDLPPEELASAVVEGVRSAETGGRRRSLFDLYPLPNYFFQRDPQVVLGDLVIVASMATDARQREPLLARTFFEFHPRLARASAALFDVDSVPPGPHPDPAYPCFEGGDVLIASPEVVLLGVSERTNRRGVEVLAEHLRREETTFRHLILVEMPPRRSYMHLDTVFTFIDRGTCLAYLPVIEPGHPESAHVYHVDLTAPELAFAVRRSLSATLDELGLPVELVPCGGDGELIDQQREQWTDGANAFAVAPGVIILYRRNHRTVEALAQRGWRVVGEEEVAAGTAEVLGHGPTVVTLLGNELSRARGGPRCMTMPLERDPL